MCRENGGGGGWREWGWVSGRKRENVKMVGIEMGLRDGKRRGATCRLAAWPSDSLSIVTTALVISDHSEKCLAIVLLSSWPINAPFSQFPETVRHYIRLQFFRRLRQPDLKRS
jgi:hypothetical protein